MASIYLAGKIAKRDWRADLVPELHDAWGGRWYTSGWSIHDNAWPIIPGGVLGIFDYAGPYYTDSCGHSELGCGQPEHRLGTYCEGDDIPGTRVVQLCLDAINRADIVFAWLNDPTAYGTLVEVGYAYARGKPVVIATPKAPRNGWDAQVDGPPSNSLNDLWFAFSMGARVIQAASPKVALQHIAGSAPRLDSPIEVAFWNAYLRSLPAELLGLKTQQPALGGRYRIDFALPEKKIGIELDGYAWHSSREAFTKDRERHRALELDGWRLIRFSGSEINNDAMRCVRQAAELVRGYEATA